MKKVLLSIAALMVTSSVFAQSFTNGDAEFTESFGATGTSCLKNFSNAGYQFADGNILSAGNTTNEITVTAVASVQAGLAPGLFDFYYTNSSDNCVSMRTANVGVDMTGGTPYIIVRAKSSIAGASVQFHLASAPNAYPSATTASVAVPTAQTEKTLTTSYAYYVVNFSGTEWNGLSAAFRQKVNMWGLLIPGDNALNNNAVITIDKIYIGSSLATGNNNANVVNDQVTLSPNPASTSFNVDMTAMNNSEAASVKVLNSNGVVVKEFTTNNNSELVYTEGLNKGIYLVQVTSANKIATKKVVVE